ncbi:microfibril-associated glycoprotein 4-like [Physella acuta]|uniref:microfibril-associated glycoprotein 4-like n=1 Tax=Physella acuta TaxID=109671 RepID=UPI0027DD2C38|nr:microfibril-associated glycoprotein 4-like [Physella acuta]
MHGVWVDADARCSCNGGWVGDFCERLAVSCVELTSYGYTLKVHVVQLQPSSSSSPISVQCALWSLNEIFTYVFSNSGDQNFNKTWDEYLYGFYINAENFWIGLKNLKLLNDNGLTDFELSTSLIATSTDVYTSYGYRYSNFNLGDESTGFAFTYGTTTTNGPLYVYYGDCLPQVSNSSFSTWDNNHVSTGNCAAVAGGGWWFRSCNFTCNPLGYRPIWMMDGLDLNNAYYAEILGYFVSSVGADYV